MGVIWTSRTRNRQPQLKTRIDGNSPLSRNLQLAWTGQFPALNVATQQNTFELVNAPPRVVTPYGVGVQLNGSNQSVNLNQKLGSAAGSWYLLLVNSVSLATGEGMFSQSTDDAGSGVAVGISQGYARAGSAIAYLFDSGTTESMKAVGGTWDSAAVKSFNLGALKDNTSGTSAPSNPSGNYFAHIGCYHYSGGRIFHKAATPVVFFYWDRALSDAEMAELHRNPWQLFAPERRPKFFSVGSGANTYAVDISETATASETVSMLASFGASISETVTASETVATTAVLNASISETATASETVSMVASFVVTIGETATASETVAMALGAATFAVDISETATASETVSMLATFGTSISETATASETVSMLATFLVGISETATASETVAMQLANQTYAVSISETATASDTVVMTIPTTYAISIIETVQAGDYVSMGVPSSDFWTQVTTTQSAGWGQINNTQSSGWTIIPTT